MLWERESGHLWPQWKHARPGVISVVPEPLCAILQIPQAEIPPLNSKKEQGEAGTGAVDVVPVVLAVTGGHPGAWCSH